MKNAKDQFTYDAASYARSAFKSIPTKDDIS